MSDSDGPNRPRRRFVNWLLGSSLGALAAAVAYPIARFVSPPDIPEATTEQVEAGPTNDPELLSQGYKIVRFGADPVIVVRVSATDFRAFAATCTHLDCIVEFRRSQGLLWCNCHDGQFDLTGRNVGGPPPRPLTPYRVHLVSRGPRQPQTIVVERS